MSNSCALCGATGAVAPTAVAPQDVSVDLCTACAAGVTDGPQDGPHWQCLHEAIWSTEPAVQVLAWRLLKALPEAPWARDLLDMAYLEPDVLAWAEAGVSDAEEAVVHRDSNGSVLSAGDTVVLIKDLPVKGAGFTAKRGTSVRNISLVMDNPEHIEGRVESQRIVILTKFVKKS
ncbi:PhnA domain-containing protein [Shimia sagamensis]|uniref:Phosphonoacetate hydrolase n=1 Tax=Shimia sagamensis TaxID=1566352 RepID=A0ABY1NMN3_9RHOB|nr:alkylphosphonate utilization protein [Shimia sagamensis]SMP13791.1 phosphonoacetate hydrolase [Shimia sagamensis]